MATLQSSGAISLSNIQSVMGGSNPASLSEYYRNGPYVPSTKTVTLREPSSGEYTIQNSWWWFMSSNGFGYFKWNYGPYVSTTGVNTTSYTSGGYTYFRGSLFGTGGNGYEIHRHYGIYRTSQSTVSINQNVPTSGVIGLNNFYGAEKP